MRIFGLLLFIYTCLLCSIGVAYAEVYPLSTEIQIGKSRLITDRAPPGAYVTVGGERAFRGAAMFAGVTQLVIIDMAPQVLRFAEINVKLLRAVNSEHYRRLRWDAELDEWLQLSPNLTRDDFAWWQQNVRNPKGYAMVEELNRYGHSLDYMKYAKVVTKLERVYPVLQALFNNDKRTFLKRVKWADISSLPFSMRSQLTEEELSWWQEEREKSDSCVRNFIDKPQQAIDLGMLVDYRGGSYLFDEHAYQRLHTLAMQDKIALVQVDLSVEMDIAKLKGVLHAKGVKIGVLDLDNLFIGHYMGEAKFLTVLRKLLEFGTDNSVLLLMNNYTHYACAQFSIYFGFTFGHVKKWPEKVMLQEFTDGFEEQGSMLLDGRLYEVGDSLPWVR